MRTRALGERLFDSVGERRQPAVRIGWLRGGASESGRETQLIGRMLQHCSLHRMEDRGRKRRLCTVLKATMFRLSHTRYWRVRFRTHTECPHTVYIL